MMNTHFLLSLLFAASFLPAKAQTYQPSAENLKARQEFQDNKFGIFLHWGLYCMLATGEWTMTNLYGSNRNEAGCPAYDIRPPTLSRHRA